MVGRPGGSLAMERTGTFGLQFVVPGFSGNPFLAFPPDAGPLTGANSEGSCGRRKVACFAGRRF